MSVAWVFGNGQGCLRDSESRVLVVEDEKEAKELAEALGCSTWPVGLVQLSEVPIGR